MEWLLLRFKECNPEYGTFVALVPTKFAFTKQTFDVNENFTKCCFAHSLLVCFGAEHFGRDLVEKPKPTIKFDTLDTN